MSLFGSLLGDFDDDPIFGHHMRSVRQMNNMMNSMFSDPFGSMFDMGMGPSALTGGIHHPQQRNIMPFGGFNSMPNINRLMNFQIPEGAASYSSSQVVSMSHGSDGRPQVYKATMSTKTGPGGVRETQKTVQDSRTGVKKMAIGHHIGHRSHVIERERNMHTGEEEERQDFINLDEDEAQDFDREFSNRSRNMIGHNGNGHRSHVNNEQLAIGPPSPQAIMPPANPSIHPHPYNTSCNRRNNRSVKRAQQHQGSSGRKQ